MQSSQGSQPYLIISSVVSIAAGLLLLLNDWDISPTVFMVAGISLLLTGILLVGKSWTAVFSVIGLGAYSIARGTGTIDSEIFRYAVGIFATVLGLAVLYKIIAGNHPNQPPPTNPTAQ